MLVVSHSLFILISYRGILRNSVDNHSKRKIGSRGASSLQLLFIGAGKHLLEAEGDCGGQPIRRI